MLESDTLLLKKELAGRQDILLSFPVDPATVIRQNRGGLLVDVLPVEARRIPYRQPDGTITDVQTELGRYATQSP